MSEEAGPQQTPEQPPAKKLPIKTILIVVGVVALEGATIVIMGAVSGPKQAQGMQPSGKQPVVHVEIQIFEGQCQNTRAGKLVVLDLEIYAKVKEQHEKALEEAKKNHTAELKDRLNRIVGGLAQNELFNVASPEVLRRQVHTLVEEYSGKETVEGILFPKYSPQTIPY